MHTQMPQPGPYSVQLPNGDMQEATEIRNALKKWCQHNHL